MVFERRRFRSLLASAAEWCIAHGSKRGKKKGGGGDFPDYWFEVEYPRSRKLLESGQSTTDSYAHTYDFYLVRSGKGKS